MTASPVANLKPEMAWVAITPETAERWLKQNNRNRRLKNRKVDEYARDMAAGNWLLTGEAIKFSVDGLLLDGQNRLNAIIKSGVTITMLVIRNLSTDAQNVMDTGSKRAPSDQLTIGGHKNTVILAAAAKLGINFEAGRSESLTVTNTEIADWIDANPGIHAAATLAGHVARKLDIAPATVAYAHLNMARIDPFEAARFWNDACEKVGLRAGDPVIALGNRFAEARRRREQMPRTAQIGFIYRAWNARRKGETLTILRSQVNGRNVGVPEPR